MGVDAAVHAGGLPCDRIVLDRAWMSGRAGVVVVKDLHSFVSEFALAQARRCGAVSVLLMDGIVEWRNTFVNPRSGSEFLRPAPVDIVACCGELDRRTLVAMGNDAVVAGLPRLGPRPHACALPERRAIMVATANRPAFDRQERRRLLGSLLEVRDRARALKVEVCWRLTGGLDAELDVACDHRPLREVLNDVRAVLTTPSTLMVESMLAGRPTAIMHVHPTPCWQPASWIWRGAPGATIDTPKCAPPQGWKFGDLHADLRPLSRTVHDAGDLIESILAAAPEAMERQRRIVDLLAPSRPPAEALAELCAELIERPRHAAHGRTMTTLVRVPSGVPAPRRPRVVNCVFCDDSPVGGVQSWAFRLADAFVREDLGYDVYTLLVTPHPHALPEDDASFGPESLTQVCVYDPTADHTEALRTVRDAIAALSPSIILPNFADICYMAATLLRARGAKILAVAHTDEDYYRELLSVYDRWDGAVGVSRVCTEWLAPLAGGKPLDTIPYGVPVSDRARDVEADGPLKIAYFGRMVQRQKRVFDLLGVIDGLEKRAVDYVLHMVGDGTELGEWRRRLAARTLKTGRVEIHGRRDPLWVQRFLQTVDASVLVSEYEGTSVSMLEAMGAGVVPVVTRVRSGVEEWVRDGETGCLCPIGEPDRMAARLAELAVDRAAVARLGAAAWQTAHRRASIPVMARAYRASFDRVMACSADAGPTDQGLRPTDPRRWCKERADDAAGAERWLRSTLADIGFKRVALDRPLSGCDAVLVRTDDPGRASPEDIAAWRSRGLGIVFSPGLRPDTPGEPVRTVLNELVRDGCSRIAVFGIGKHSRALAPVFCDPYPIVGFIDDRPPEWGRFLGLPVVTLDRAAEELRPDAVLISSDAWERQMWERCGSLRRAGVRIVTLYGTYGTTGVNPPSPVLTA